MKKITILTTFLALSTLLISMRPVHQTQINIISPKVNAMYKTGQIVDVHVKLSCEEKLKTVVLEITQQDNKVLLSKSLKTDGKRTLEEKMTWKIPTADPSVFTLSVHATDEDGHSSSKIVQFNANF
jgi:Glycosyl hydrolase family 66